MKLINQSHEILNEPDRLKLIELAGRTCYKSESRITSNSASKFVSTLVKSGHWSVLEHSSVSFEIDEGTFWWIRKTMSRRDLISNYVNADNYLTLSNLDRFVVSGNFRAWKEFLSIPNVLMNDDIRGINYYLAKTWPEIFTDIVRTNVMVEPLRETEMSLDEKILHKRISVRFITNRGCCYDDKTEILTSDGFKLFKDLTSDDAIWTLNPETKQPEYQTPTQYHEYDWNGELIGGKSSMVDFLVTPNHRMFYFHYDSRKQRQWKINQADKIYKKRIKFQRGLFYPQKGVPVPEDYPQQNTLPFARFLGMFITDGSKYKRFDTGGKVTLHQTKEFGKKYIKNFLTQLGWKYSEKDFGFVIHSTALYKFLHENFAQVRHEYGRVPYWIKDAPRDYLEQFIRAVIKGDGNTHKTNGHEVIYTTNKALADDYQECILRLGFCSTVRTDDRTGQERVLNGNIIHNNKPCYVVSITRRTTEHLFNKKHWYKKHYQGKVYCVSVPNGIVYVRRNNKAFWSGNSHELVRHRSASFSQESTRYVKYNKSAMEFIRPVWGDFEETKVSFLKPSSAEFKFIIALDEAESYYNKLLALGWKAEQAREVLPNSLKTELVMTTSVREWYHVMKLRTAKAAHPQIRDLMHGLLTELIEIEPDVFGDLS